MSNHPYQTRSKDDSHSSLLSLEQDQLASKVDLTTKLENGDNIISSQIIKTDVETCSETSMSQGGNSELIQMINCQKQIIEDNRLFKDGLQRQAMAIDKIIKSFDQLNNTNNSISSV